MVSPNVHPELNNVVTISFKRQQEGVPITARIYQIRTDVKWEDVVRNHEAAQLGEVPEQTREAGKIFFLLCCSALPQQTSHRLTFDFSVVKRYSEVRGKEISIGPLDGQ